ncbi:hypothetical protein Celaphus_00017195 [Cervus elaphus hippelaphus]|uniref:Uncharacterized protein n=1 Tax=Cervus elaphus hippelaphus TaxID=46360 RepID=A0A212CMH0_CEREH|nr:hypothetical protein Celaphus_00017195 [Cervus elaphus hippelaphus]
MHFPSNKSNLGQRYCEIEVNLAQSLDFWTLSSENIITVDSIQEKDAHKEVPEDMLDLDLSVSETDDFIQLVAVTSSKAIPRFYLRATQLTATQDLGKGYTVPYYTRFRELIEASLGLVGEREGDRHLLAFLTHLMQELVLQCPAMTFQELSEIPHSQLLGA